MKILIVGAGIGGLSAAGFFEKNGFDVTLIEKAPEFKHIGFGMTIFSNGREMLQELGLDEKISEKGYQIPWIEVTDTKGKIVGRKVEFKDFYKYGDPAITIERADLHSALVLNLKSTKLRLGTTIQEFKSEKDFVKVKFSDKTEDIFDLLVAADGINSSIREQLFGKNQSTFYGWSLRFFWAPLEVPRPVGAICLSKEKTTLALYPLKDKFFAGTYEYNPQRIEHPPLKIQEFLPYLTQHGWEQKHIDALTKEANEGHQYYDHLRHITLGEWYQKRIVLLGDARHGLSPITGMGGSMAMEDAFVLSDELSKVKSTNIEIALSRYAKRRTKRLKQMQSLSHLAEKFYFIKSRFDRISRNLIANFFGKRIEKKILMGKISRMLELPY